MKYILKYKIKSKYFGFVKEYMKEFNNCFDVFHFVINNEIMEWRLYKYVAINSTDLLEINRMEDIYE